METNSCLAIPSNEDGELTVYASTQNPTEGQKLIAHALNISMNKVVVKVKRLGGGFGGKETRCTPLMVAAAFAASKINLPVKFSLDRDQVIFKCIMSLWDQITDNFVLLFYLATMDLIYIQYSNINMVKHLSQISCPTKQHPEGREI